MPPPKKRPYSKPKPPRNARPPANKNQARPARGLGARPARDEGSTKSRAPKEMAPTNKDAPLPPKTTKPKKNPAPEPVTRDPLPVTRGARPAQPGEPQRLHAFIAHAGVCSRRAAEKLIQEGRVELNGKIVTEMGLKVGPDDDVRVDGQRIRQSKQFTLILNKPIGVVTTLLDPQRRQTIVKFLPDMGVQLKPVGRLDMETEGLLICTNDGELAHRLAHPSYGIDKEYVAVVQGIPDDKALKALREGVFVEGRKTAPAKIEVIHAEKKSDTTGLRITIHEGRKRQIRLMCEAVGNPVKSLKRVRIGPLILRGLRSGECKMLGKKDVDELRRLVGLRPS